MLRPTGALGGRPEGLRDEIFEVCGGRREPGGGEFLGGEFGLESLESRTCSKAVGGRKLVVAEYEREERRRSLALAGGVGHAPTR